MKIFVNEQVDLMNLKQEMQLLKREGAVLTQRVSDIENRLAVNEKKGRRYRGIRKRT